jgi:hypothetical protein
MRHLQRILFAEKDGDQRNTAVNMIRPLAVIFSLVFKANTENILTDQERSLFSEV